MAGLDLQPAAAATGRLDRAGSPSLVFAGRQPAVARPAARCWQAKGRPAGSGMDSPCHCRASLKRPALRPRCLAVLPPQAREVLARQACALGIRGKPAWRLPSARSGLRSSCRDLCSRGNICRSSKSRSSKDPWRGLDSKRRGSAPLPPMGAWQQTRRRPLKWPPPVLPWN